MRRAILILLLLLIASAVCSRRTHGDEPNNVAQGAEKAAHEQAHPNEGHGGEHEAPKTYFGIPGWILKLANMLLFLGVLGWFLGGPIKKALIDRRDADSGRCRRGQGAPRESRPARGRHPGAAHADRERRPRHPGARAGRGREAEERVDRGRGSGGAEDSAVGARTKSTTA